MEEKLSQLTFGRATIIGLVLAAVYFFTLYNDGTVIENQIAASQGEVQKNRAEVESIRQAILDAERYQQTMSVLGAEMEKVVKAIPAKLNSLDLMKTISTEAKGVGAEINQLNSPQTASIGTADENPNRFYEVIPIEVDITGTYNQIMLFLSNLTKLDKIITAERLIMAISQRGSGKSSSSVPIINMKASLQAYRYKPPVKRVEVPPATGGGDAE